MSFIKTKKSFLRAFVATALLGLITHQGTAQISTFPYSYDFENEGSFTSCGGTYTILQPGWVNDGADQMEWGPDVAGTGSLNTGPDVDHTLGTSTGKYLYTETSGCNNMTANLISPVFDFSVGTAPEFTFWYHMAGATMGSLFLEARIGTGAWTTLFSRTGAQQGATSTPWIQAVVPLTAYVGMNNIQFRFRALTGTSFTSDMAIDDIVVRNPVPDNAGITAMLSPVPGAAPGSYSVDVTLRNFGGNALNNVTVEWEINGTPQTAVPFAGPAIPASGSIPFNLSASTAFVGGFTNLKFWTSNPNGMVDPVQGNDTLYAYYCTGLAGTYTVGTAGSNFLTIPDAIGALYSCGVSGPVVFQVQPGVYNTPMVIDQAISGLSATNNITFDGGSQAATITASSGSVVFLDGADYITIQNFIIENTTTGNGTGIWLTGGADFNKILNNRITLPITTNTLTGGIVASGSTTSFGTSGSNANYTLIEGNVVIGADRGITMYGSATTTLYNNNNVIKNNEIYDADTYGIYAYYQDSIQISGNYIHNLVSLTHYGMYTYYLMNFDITGNDVRVDDYGIYTNRSNSEIASVRRGLIANNMIQSTADRAFYLFFTRATDFYHNTLVSTTTPCYWTDIDNTVDVKNNIFVTSSLTDYAFQCATSTAFMGMDNNVFYVPAGNPSLISYNGIYTDLVDWQTTGPYTFDQNSLEGMPQFISSTDLHVEGVFLNDKGAPTTLTYDFDGQLRPAAGALAADIGADEFTPPMNDAGVLAMVSPILPISAGFSSVEVTIKNYGIADLATFMIEWEINGMLQTPVNYVGPSVPVGGTKDVILANINFPVNTTSLRFWTSMPNGMVDERFDNDTLAIDLCPGLAGTYTVGHSTSDFPTAAEAIKALMTCGVNAPVTMEFVGGTYTGPWTIGVIPGASAANTVTLDGMSSSTTILTHNGFGVNKAATLILDGTDYLTIKNFTIENTGVTNAYGVLLTHEADHNTLESNKIMSSTASGLSNVAAVVTSGSYSSTSGSDAEANNANWNLILNNDISGGQTGVLLRGGPTDFENVANQVVGNYIHDAADYGVWADEQDSLVVSKNTIDNLVATSSDAVFLLDVHNYSILANKITSKDYGIAITGAFADECAYGLIANNMVSCGANGEALYMNYVALPKIYHNTLRGMPAVYVNNHSNIDVRSNIMTTTTSYCFQSASSTSLGLMDNNLYYVSGAGGNVARIASTNYATLAAWKALGYDQNSVSGNPNFVNGLYIGNSLAVDTASTTLIIPIMTDIDGDARPMGIRNDIGADERIIIANDAMIANLVSPAGCGSAAHDIIVSLANVGTSNMGSVPVVINVTGSATATFNATHPLLLSGTTVNINVGTLNTAVGGTYNFEIIVNAGTDTNPLNDTLYRTISILPSNQNALTMVGDTMVCDGLTARIQANAAYAPATIHWYDAATGGNLVHIGNTFVTGNLSAPVIYYAEISGCNSARAMTTVNLDMMGINVELGADQTICGGLGAEIMSVVTISPAVSTLWSDGSQATNLEVLNAGQYFATVTNVYGCVHTDSIMINVSPMPSIVSNAMNNVTCGGAMDGSVDLSVTGGTGPFSFLWSNGATTEDLTAVAGGSYNVTVTDNGTAGCAYVSNYNINEPATVVVNMSSSPYACNGIGGNVTLSVTGGTTGYSFLWSTADTVQNLSNVGAGTYTVTVTDANGCSTTAMATITTPTAISIVVDTIFDEILQLGGEIHTTITGGNGTLQYVWSTGATTATITGLNAGTYSVTVTDLATGCQQVLGGLVVVYKIPDFVNTISAVNSFKLYPNPTNGRVWVNMELSSINTVQLQVYSATGQLLLSYEPREAIEQNYELDMSEFPSGIYLARFVIGSEVMTTKIVVE